MDATHPPRLGTRGLEKKMTAILTIKASTTTEEIEAAIPFIDMREEALERRDDAAAVIADQGDQAVLEYHNVDGISVLYSPSFGYAYVNQYGPGAADSLLVENGDADSAEHAAQIYLDAQ
jgi:hypothetical protein